MTVKRIKMCLGVTINLGEYQSFRADVGAEADDDSRGYDQLKVLVTQRLTDVVEEFGLKMPIESEKEA